MSITQAMIEQAGEKLYIDALLDLPEDITAAMEAAIAAEPNEMARFQLGKILENAAIARERRSVICQDTCISSYKIKVGGKAVLEEGGDIAKALRTATARASHNLPTIPHSVHPLTKVNSGDGTGPCTPILHWDFLPGADYIEITAQPVGGGGDLCSALKMFSASVPFHEIERFIIDTVAAAGSKPCPPMVIGIGLGGMFENVSSLAKEAVMRPLDRRHPEKQIADLEEELLELINSLGIGPMGLGGKTTCLALNIEYGNTHTPVMPVSIKISCWAIRRKTARLNGDGTIDYL